MGNNDIPNEGYFEGKYPTEKRTECGKVPDIRGFPQDIGVLIAGNEGKRLTRDQPASWLMGENRGETKWQINNVTRMSRA